MKVTGTLGAPVTVDSFNAEKMQAFQQVMSNCTGQPPEWIMVRAASLSPPPASGAPASPPARRRSRALLQAPQQQTPILLASQVHADLPQIPNVIANMNASLANGQLQRQLRGIGLVLVRNSVVFGAVTPAPPPPAEINDSGGGTSDVVKIVVPIVSVVGALSVAGIAAAWYVHRKRKRQAAAEGEAARAARRSSRRGRESRSASRRYSQPPPPPPGASTLAMPPGGPAFVPQEPGIDSLIEPRLVPIARVEGSPGPVERANL